MKALLLLASLAAWAPADELTEDMTAIRDSRLTPLSRFKRSLDQTARPVDAPPGADLDGALANLAALKARLEPSSKRLEDMRYGSLEDLSTIDPERAVLRAELEAGGRVLDEKLDALEALKRAAVLVKFQKVAAGGLRPGNASDLNAAVRLTRAGDDFLHLQGRVRAALAFDEKFYRERKAELDAHERARARRRNIAAAACFVVAAFGAVAVFVKLR